jgi:broad specificity phosphatase PhoE
MSSIIYLVRHAESEHNVSKDFSQQDPPLTAAGVGQASALIQTFPDAASVAVMLTSPLTRTLQTTIASFPQVLRKDAAGSAQLIIDPDLQERSNLPCDTGSRRTTLEEAFPELDFGGLADDWFVKEGLYAADDAAVATRAQRFRERLREIVTSLEKDRGEADQGRQRNVVVVTHGVFMKFLAKDETIDLPKAGWKAFTIGSTGDGDAELVSLA